MSTPAAPPTRREQYGGSSAPLPSSSSKINESTLQDLEKTGIRFGSTRKDLTLVMSEVEDQLDGRNEVDENIRKLQTTDNLNVSLLEVKFPEMVAELTQMEEECLESKLQLAMMMANLLQIFQPEKMDAVCDLADLVESMELDVERELLEHEKQVDNDNVLNSHPLNPWNSLNNNNNNNNNGPNDMSNNHLNVPFEELLQIDVDEANSSVVGTAEVAVAVN